MENKQTSTQWVKEGNFMVQYNYHNEFVSALVHRIISNGKIELVKCFANAPTLQMPAIDVAINKVRKFVATA